MNSAHGGIDLGVAAKDRISELLERVSDYLPEDATSLIEDAYFFADRSHDGQLRKSGEPYIAHPLEIALYLSDLRLDEQTIAASLLHDVVEDCDVTLEELSGKFGPEIAKLVDGVTKLTRLDSRIHDPLSAMSDGADYRDSLYAESLRKMLVAMAEDIRVVLIKLADRLHNMKTLDALPPEKQRRIAQETLDIYSPLAHRLGIWEIKWQLDDLAFRHLDIDKYREISRMLSARRVEREEYVERVSDELRLKLDTEDIKAEVSGRPKNIYSTYRKIQKYEAEGKMLSDIYDLFALRVLVEKEIDCYRVLGVVHQLWHPIPGQIDDYISNAKENGYRALHTTVLCEGGTHLEVQIKTVDMHQVAEYGVAAHWRYKEGKTSDVDFEEKMSELRQLLEWQRDVTKHRRVHRVCEAGHSPRPGIRLHTQGAHRRIDRRLHSGGLRLQDSHRVGPPLRRGQGQRQAGVAGHAAAKRRHRGNNEHQVGPRPQPRLAQSQPGIRPFRGRPPEHTAVVQPAEARDQHPAGPGDTAPRDAPSQPEIRRQRSPGPVQARHHGRAAGQPGLRRCDREPVGPETGRGPPGTGTSPGPEADRPAACPARPRGSRSRAWGICSPGWALAAIQSPATRFWALSPGRGV